GGFGGTALLAAHREVPEGFDDFYRQLARGFERAFPLLFEGTLEAQELRLHAFPLGTNLEPGEVQTHAQLVTQLRKFGEHRARGIAFGKSRVHGPVPFERGYANPSLRCSGENSAGPMNGPRNPPRSGRCAAGSLRRECARRLSKSCRRRRLDSD